MTTHLIDSIKSIWRAN